MSLAHWTFMTWQKPALRNEPRLHPPWRSERLMQLLLQTPSPAICVPRRQTQLINIKSGDLSWQRLLETLRVFVLATVHHSRIINALYNPFGSIDQRDVQRTEDVESNILKRPAGCLIPLIFRYLKCTYKSSLMP